jgi:hypothetical protein
VPVSVNVTLGVRCWWHSMAGIVENFFGMAKWLSKEITFDRPAADLGALLRWARPWARRGILTSLSSAAEVAFRAGGSFVALPAPRTLTHGRLLAHRF